MRGRGIEVSGYEKRRTLRMTAGVLEDVDDPVAVECRLRISAKGEEILGLYASPVMVKELVVGYLASEGIIKGRWCADGISLTNEGKDILVDIPLEGEVSLEGGTMTSGCLGGITFDREFPERPPDEGMVIEGHRLKALFDRFQGMSGLYRLTGCIHSAALSDGKRILAHGEDIGRHNAVDKVIGRCLLEGIPLEGKVMLVSGRLSSEMVSKCSRWRIPVVVSRTAPTTLAVDMAEARGVTLIGFMRASRFTVYTHPGRIVPGNR